MKASANKPSRGCSPPGHVAQRGRSQAPRPKAAPDDVYVAEMLEFQRRQLMTTSDNRTSRAPLPSPYRRLLVHSPVGQARRGVAYSEMRIQEPQAQRAGRCSAALRACAKRLMQKLRRLGPQPPQNRGFAFT